MIRNGAAIATHKSGLLLVKALLLSFIAVALCVVAIGGLGWVVEAEQLNGTDPCSINSCILTEHQQQALSLFRLGGSKRQLGAHRLLNGEVSVEIAWPYFEPACMTASPINGQLFVGSLNGDIYSAVQASRASAPAKLGRHIGFGPDSMECSADGRYLLSIGPSALCAWNLDLQAFQWSRAGVISFAIAPSSASVVCATTDGQILELSIDCGSPNRTIGQLGWMAQKIAISSNGQRFVCVGDCGEIQMFDLPNFKTLWQIPQFPSYSAAVRIAIFSPRAKVLITPCKKDVRNLALWSVETGERLGELRGHEKVVIGAAFADENRLVSWSADGTIRTWNVQNRRVLCVTSLAVPGQQSPAASGDSMPAEQQATRVL